MKRTLAVAGFTMLGTLLVFCNINNEAAMLYALSASSVAFVLSVIIPETRKNKTLPTALLFVIISLLVLNTSNKDYFKLTDEYIGKQISISGYLTSPAYKKDSKNYYIIKTDTVNSEIKHINIRIVSSSPIDFEPTDKINTTIKLFALGTDDETYLNYYKSSALTMGGYPVGEVSIQKSENYRLSQLILKLRVRMSKIIMRVLPNDYGAVITGLVLGDKSNLSIKTKNAFRFCGVSHLFAVSGLHISLWALSFFELLKKLGLSYKKCSFLAILFCLFFMALTGFNPPVVRSGFMMIMVFAAELCNREADAFNSIGFSLIVMLLLNPYNAVSVSLLLSVLATSGILILHPLIIKRITIKLSSMKNGKLKALVFSALSIVSVSISVTVFTMPIYASVFGAISTLQIISNLFMVCLGTLCMETAGIGAVLCVAKLNFAGKPLILFSGILSKVLTETAYFLSNFRYAVFPLNTKLSLMVLLIAFIIGLTLYSVKCKKQKLISFLCVSFAFIFSSVNILCFAHEFNCLKLCVAKVGDGVGVIASYKGKNIIFTNGGDYFSEKTICDIIDKNGISTIDYLCLTSSDASCNNLLFGYKVQALYTVDKSKFDNVTLSSSIYETDKNIFEINGLKIGVDKYYAQIFFGETKILIAFSDECKFKSDNYDIYIFKNTPCEGISSDFYISSCSSFEKLNNTDIYRVNEYGSISILVKEDKTFQYWSV